MLRNQEPKSRDTEILCPKAAFSTKHEVYSCSVFKVADTLEHFLDE